VQASAELPAVMVVLDPGFGERLRELWPGGPVWIVMSPINTPVIEALRPAAPDHDRSGGITGIPYEEKVPPEELLLAHLWDIDLHHGPYSSSAPYRVLKVLGASPTAAVREVLRDLGFERITATGRGFSTVRSQAAASARR